METLGLTGLGLVLAGSFGLSLLLTPLVRRIAVATGRVAVPRDTRWHRRETALLGGVAIFAAMTASWILSSLWTGWGIYPRGQLAMMFCAAAVFGLGLVDDIRGMDPQHKLAGQIVITAVLMFFGFRLGWTDSKTINLFISILWVVGVTNAFNLLDNMDGLSAGVAFVGGGFLFLNIYLNAPLSPQALPILVLTAAYLGALLGFLVYNFNPASIFMGDAGSLFIGFVLGSLTVAGSRPLQAGGSPVQLLSVICIPILLLFVPILDTGFVSLMRKLFRRPISQGGRDHSSHRLVAIGFSERRAVLMLYAFSGVSGLIALAVSRLDLGVSLVVIILYLLAVLFFWIYLAKVKVYPETSILESRESGLITPILVEITYKRRLLEVLLDLVLISVAYYAAYLLRFEGSPGPNFDFFLKSLPILIACQVLCFFVFGVYRGVWASTSLRDLITYIKAVTLGSVLPMLILLFLYRFFSFSRAVFVIYWGLMLILVSLSRLSFRLLEEGLARSDVSGKPTLIYGAGIGGQMLVKELETDHHLGLKLVGFVDDNRRIQRRRVRGYPILGGQPDLPKLIARHRIGEIIVSFREGGEEKQRELKSLCDEMGAEVQVRRMKLIIG